MPPSTRQHRHHYSRQASRLGTAKKQPVFATYDELSQRPLRNIIVDCQTTVHAISAQRRLIGLRIRTRLTQTTLRKNRCNTRTFAAQVEKLVQERHRVFLATTVPLRNRLPFDLRLNL